MGSIGVGGGDATSAELVAGVATLAAELATQPAPESGAACYEQVEVLGRAIDLIESAIAARVAVATGTGQVAEWGHTSPAAWLRTTLGMRGVRAQERAVLAAQLPRLPQVAKRLAAGDLSAGYAAAIAASVRRLDATDCGKAEDLLLGLIDDGHSVGQITRFADKIKDLIAERDGTATEPEDGRRAERQWWAIQRSGTGAFTKGRFGPELLALIEAKLKPLVKPCGPQDTRDHAERLADALQIFLSGGDSRWDPILIIELNQPLWRPRTAPSRTPASPGQDHRDVTPAAGRDRGENGFPGSDVVDRPLRDDLSLRDDQPLRDDLGAAGHAVPDPIAPSSPMAERSRVGSAPYRHDSSGQHRFIAPPPATAQATSEMTSGESGAARAADDGAANSPWAFQPPAPGWPFDGTPFTARLADGTPISTQRARQVLLNAGFSTLVLGTDGQPLYLGRRVRCATPAQRRVLLTRYPTCAVHGCDIPATACQVDHVDGWENGQPSDIDRLVPCCAWHNRYKWQRPDRVTVSRRDDGRYRYDITRPDSRHGDRRPGRKPAADQPERAP